MILSRRRTLGILAAAALPLSGTAQAKTEAHWQGQALGADASIRLRHPDRQRADAALKDCQREISRLENVFSLFRRSSTITRLNWDGHLERAPTAMIDLLHLAERLSQISDGAFDVTVQPLWNAYARGGDQRRDVEAGLSLVDWQGVQIDGRKIRLAREGMAITLNGIAQGYMTDRIADRLRQSGFAHVLVHLGEYRGLGRREDGRPWQVGIADPLDQGLIDQIALDNRAIATSSPWGTRLATGDQGDIGHLLDPRTGRPISHWQSVSVVAERATIADGLSTTIAIAPPENAQTILQRGGGERVFLVGADGRRLELQSSTG